MVFFRCRYLEEAGCASICINSCKVPTQEFFRRNMGMDVSLEPNYDDFSCQFAFGKKPLPQVRLLQCAPTCVCLSVGLLLVACTSRNPANQLQLSWLDV